MHKLWGWLNLTETNALNGDTSFDRMRDASRVLPVSATSFLHESCAIGTNVQHSIAKEDGLYVALIGQPRLVHSITTRSTAQQLLTLWREHGKEALQHLHGTFALAIIDTKANTALLAIDRVGVQSLAFSHRGGGLVFASRADAVAAHPAVGDELSFQALFNYLYFYTVPAPGTIYQNVEKLLPGQYAWFQNGRLERQFYWHLKYRDEPRTDFDEMSKRFHVVLRDSVDRAAADESTAAFLSGGTDSSTVAGILTERRSKPSRTYSIGFSADGFDEMEYARIAGRHFGLDMREYYLTPDDVLTAIPIIAAHYDEPFGNESAVPTYFCAKLARDDGYDFMLAGDGGDELFGGNTRYAKQKIFEAYSRIPALLRTGLIEPLSKLPGFSLLPPTRKLQSYLRQANIPLPERTESYNMIYRQPLAEMYTPDFLSRIDASIPSAALQEVYSRTNSTSYINRMMHLDMKFTIADNDLRKVNGMTEAAGVEVRYPLLDDAMVSFSGDVPPDWKVRGYNLRWFYKAALKGYLPDAIINKSKHGFGLPFGVWAREHAPLRERIEDRLADFKRRNWLQPSYVDYLRAQHLSGHATYYGRMLWVIVILEEWLTQRGK